MKAIRAVQFSALVLLTGCMSTKHSCEDITLASEQMQACGLLQKQIIKAKGNPIIRTELERRYQKDCIDVRYYRDDKQEHKCTNEDNESALPKK